MIRVDNPLASPSFTNQFISLGDIDNTSVAVPAAPQNGTSQSVDTGDPRVQNVIWRDNHLFAVNTIVPPSGPDAGQATAHWYEIDTTSLGNLTLSDQGNIGGEDIAAGTYTFYPSVAVDAVGNVAVGFAASGPSIYPGAYYAVHETTDAAGTVGPTGTLAAGQDYYYRAFGGDNRWGDYSAISIDPANDLTFWVYNEYAITRGTVLSQFPGEDGRWGTRWGSLRVANTPPTANAGGPYQLGEGASLSLDASLSSDPDSDPLSYTWDVNGDSVFGDATGVSPALTWTQLQALGITNGPSTFNVRVQVDDGFGGTVVSAPVTLTIQNVAPTAGVAGPAVALRGTQQTFSLSAFDASPDDQSAGFTFSINWGDGSPVQMVNGPSGMQVTHGFDAAGSLSVNVTATDQDGATSAAATQGVQVDAVQLLPNAQNPALVDLVWGGTSGSDHVQFTQLTSTTIRIQETLLKDLAVSNVLDFSGVTGRVIASAAGGNDQLDASGLVTTQATLDGGDGDDTLFGGSAGDILIGGTDGGEGQQGSNVIIAGNGDNTIYGNGLTALKGATGGNNLIVGGTGHDTIYGNFGTNPTGDGGEGGQNLIVGGGDDDTVYASQVVDGAEGGHGSILVAGSTTLDQAALLSVLSEWTSTRTVADKIANISGTGTGPRNNGNNFLEVGVTVFDDSDADTLYSDSNGDENWLLLALSEDTANRVKPSDVETDLS